MAQRSFEAEEIIRIITDIDEAMNFEDGSFDPKERDIYYDAIIAVSNFMWADRRVARALELLD